MSFVRSASILPLLLLSLVLLGACGTNSSNTANTASTAPTSNANSSAPRTNAEELGVIINVPYTPEDIVWKEYATPRKLRAVFRFSPEDSAKIVAAASASKPPEPASVSSEPWFPDELIAQGGATGDDSLKGLAYVPDLFVQEPFNTGRVIRIEGTDYFVLELDAK